MRARTPIVWDMETGDPDDFLTLLMLLDHPWVDLKAVTVTPGTPCQIGVVRHGMALLDRDLPVGAHDITRTDREVSEFHYRAFGDIPPSTVARPAVEVLLEHVDEQTTLLTGGPNQNLAAELATRPRSSGASPTTASASAGSCPRTSATVSATTPPCMSGSRRPATAGAPCTWSGPR